MKKILLLYSFFLPFTLAVAQTGLNVALPIPYPETDITDMILDNDTLIVYGLGFDSDTAWRQGLVVAKIDSSGQLLSSIIILDSLGDKLSIYTDWGKIIKTSDGGYLATGATFHRQTSLLIKLKHNLDIEYIKEYTDTTIISNFDFRPLEVQGGYFLFGSVQGPDYFLDGIVKYVDENGDLIWQKLFTNYYGNRVLDLAKLNDSCFALVTVEPINQMTSNTIQSSKSAIYIMDQQGNIIRSWHSTPDPDIGYLRKVIPLEDGSLITYGVARKGVLGSFVLVQPTLARFDTSFNIKWVHSFGLIKNLGANVTLQDFVQTADGNFVGAGKISEKTGNEPTRGHGWLRKFSATGDSIWHRSITTTFPDVFPNGGQFYGVAVLSSGDIVAAGRAYTNSNSFCWVVKVSNDGCLDTLYCQVSSVSEGPPLAVPASMTAYPVPADQHLTVEYPRAAKLGVLRLMDLQGRVVQIQHLPAGSTQITLNIGHLSSGLYLLEVRSGASPIERTKVLITH